MPALSPKVQHDACCETQFIDRHHSLLFELS